MKQVIQFLGYFLIALGLIAIAGSGGDCDGRCGPGNSISEMMQIAGIGLAMMVTGFYCALQQD